MSVYTAEYVHDHKHKIILQPCYTMQYKTQEQ